jgi:uncharacterized protein YigE (DUF2233 family)
VSRRLVAAAFLAALAGSYFLWQSNAAAPPAEPNQSFECNPIAFGGKRFTECIAIPGKHRVAMRITGRNGVIYRGFSNLAQDVNEAQVAFAINGGMYDVQSKPIGYYVEDGERLHPLNTRDAGGNFYLKPNGVFFGSATGDWQIMTSEDFATKIALRPEFGTQSGPMLLIGGKLHPQISEDGTSLKLRNGAGIDPQGRAHFVISDEPVSFGSLALLMRDHVLAKDALYLDGTVSALWDPASGRMDADYPLGPLIVVMRAQ